MCISRVKMAESFLDMCWDANDEEVVSNGSNADADEEYQEPGL